MLTAVALEYNTYTDIDIDITSELFFSHCVDNVNFLKLKFCSYLNTHMLHRAPHALHTRSKFEVIDSTFRVGQFALQFRGEEMYWEMFLRNVYTVPTVAGHGFI